ncbi:P83/100 family protein, partial [Scytonema tolypothrichoides VB-61278_2]
MSKASIYTVGGTVQANQNGVYISRQADEELLALCRESKFSYILTSRQMGKSSLMVRTVERLAEEEIQSVVIDVTQIGTQVTAEQWYLGLLTIIEGTLLLDTDVVQWWQGRAHLGFTQRLTLFFREVLLPEVATPIVIFVDEIDTTLSLNFTDDFFAAVRSLYVARASEPEFHRLSFVLIGVATPGDLIRDPKRTPFNIGQLVDLTDFTFEEAKPLAEGLDLPKDEALQVLGWVLRWTGGHPYLTQRLCSIIRQKEQKSWSQADVDGVVSSNFFGKMSEQDNNLQFVRDMLTKRAPDEEGVLTTYRSIRRGRLPVLDEERSLVKSHLKLSGVVKREGAILKVRNQIYHRVFDLKWVNQHLPLKLRDLWERLKPSQPLLVTGLLIFSVSMGVLAWYAEMKRREVKKQSDNATQNAQLAQQNEQEAQKALRRAKTLQKEEEKQRQLAEQRGKQLADSLQKTKLAQQAETKQRQLAEQRGKQLADSLQETQLTQQAEAKQRQLAEQRGKQLANSLQKTQAAEKLAVQRQQEAQKQRDIAKQRETEANNAKVQAEKLQVNSEIEAQSLTTENILNSYPELEALAAGLKLGKKVKSKKLEGETRSKAISVLYRIVYEIKERNRFEVHGNFVNSVAVAFSPDGKTIATASDDSTVRLWNLKGESLQTLIGHSKVVNSVAFSPDGKTIATASDDSTVRLWNLKGESLQTLIGQSGVVTSVAFSPDGKTIATASSDNTVRLWNLKGESLQTLTGHSKVVNSVAFSPDGKTIATASSDRTVRLWNLKGESLQTLIGHSGTVWSVAFSPDGKTIATASSDRTVRLWNL